MRLSHIEAFNALMITGTVSGAARLLHVTQPAVTQTLQHAELKLGYQLFTRQRNRLMPTREAQVLYPAVQQLMSQLEGVRRIAVGLRTGTDTTLRVLIVPSLAVRALPEALARFRGRYPDMPISVRTLHSNEVARAMALQEGDVGIVYGNVQHAGLREERVATGRLVHVARLQRAGSDKRTTIALADVLIEPFIRIDERDPLGAMLADQWNRLGVVPSAGISVQTHHIAMVLAEEGFGPAIIDSFTAQSSRCKELHVRTITPEIPVEVRALIAPGEHSPQPVEAFVAAMRAATASLQGG
jgi:DNA-binding transcriptional LysR family regulator